MKSWYFGYYLINFTKKIKEINKNFFIFDAFNNKLLIFVHKNNWNFILFSENYIYCTFHTIFVYIFILKWI